jgi:hypothetical protein
MDRRGNRNGDEGFSHVCHVRECDRKWCVRSDPVKRCWNSFVDLFYYLGVTLSPRLCSGHSEPVFESSLDVELLPGTGLSDNLMTVNARCSNCRTWKTGSLDVNSTAQPWIYALGPNSVNNVNIRSDSVTAGIERHSIYGSYLIPVLWTRFWCSHN